MAEEQLEIEIQGCIDCGKPLPKYPEDMKEERCNPCYHRTELVERDFMMVRSIIRQMIFSDISKADLHLFEIIMVKLADQEAFETFEINQSKLAKEIDWQQANISRSLKKLLQAGLLVKNGKLYSYGHPLKLKMKNVW